VHTAEGYAKHTANPSNPSAYGAFDYVYNYTDHLGNIRLSYVLDPSGEGLKVMEENHYYPFGLKHSYNLLKRDIGYFDHLFLDATLDPDQDIRKTRMVGNNGYQYKYNGKEWQDELGLGYYDFGWRNYDPAIGRWMNIDPLAERRQELTTYNYVQNSPMFRFDPDGLTDFTLNKKTGEVKQVGDSNDEPDRILKTNRKGEVKTNRKGEAKVAVKDIEKNILQDGQNFKTDSNVFEVGGKGQPTKEGIEKFALQLSSYVGKEIGGAYYSKDGVKDITHMTIGAYQLNEYGNNKNNGYTAIRKITSNMTEYNRYLKNIRGNFHTHPNESTRFQSSPADRNSRDRALETYPNMFFIIITHPEPGGKYPTTIDYTKHN